MRNTTTTLQKTGYLNQKDKIYAKIGSIMYVMVETHINIAFTKLMVSYFTKNLKPDHFSAVNQILRYLADS